MKKLLFALLLMASPAVSPGAPLAAEAQEKKIETEKLFVTPPVVVTGTRTERELFESPASISVVDEKELEISQPSTLREALESVPNIDFSDATNPISQKLSIRGSDINQNIVIIDGAKQNYSSAGGINPGAVFADPDMLKQIEVKRGASSVLYGSGGIGGTLSLTTKDAADLLEPDENFGGKFRTGFRTGNQEIYNSLSLFGRHNNWDFLGMGALRFGRNTTTSAPGSGNHSARDADYSSVLLKVGNMLSDNQRLSVSYNFDDGASKSRSGTSEFKNRQHRLNENYELKAGDLLDLKVVLQQEWRDFSYYNVTVDREDEFSSFGGSVQNTSRLDFDMVGNVISYGLDVYYDQQTGTNFGVYDSTRPDANSLDMGVFLQDEIFITEYVQIIPAVRFTHYRRESDKGVAADQEDSQFSPSVTLQLSPVPWFNVFGSYATSYRPPSMDELYYHSVEDYGFITYSVLPNVDLDPERAKTWEVGFNVNAEDLFTDNDFLGIKFVYFDQDVKDLIITDLVYEDTSGTPWVYEFQNINVNRAERHGYEAEALYRNRNITVSLAYGKVSGKNKDTGEKVGGMPQTVTARISYTFESIGLTPYWKSRFVDEYSSVTAWGAEYTSDRHDVHGAGFTWQPVFAWGKGFQMDFMVDNIFDKRYSIYHGPNYYEMGQSFKLTLGYRF